MNINNKNNTACLVFVLRSIVITSIISLSACAGSGTNKTAYTAATAKSHVKPYSESSAIMQMTDDKKYRVTLHSNVFPIPMQKIHSWTAQIETADGKPLEKAKIYIHGGMPAHRHGFPVQPRVKKYLGDGKHLINGVKFSMMGDWEMRINIKEETRRDRAVFKIKIAP
jgi:hypothetical protein